MFSIMKYPKPHKNFPKILLISNKLEQVRTTNHGLQLIKYKSAKALNKIQTKVSDKLNIGYWSKNRLSKSLKKHYFNKGS